MGLDLLLIVTTISLRDGQNPLVHEHPKKKKMNEWGRFLNRIGVFVIDSQNLIATLREFVACECQIWRDEELLMHD